MNLLWIIIGIIVIILSPLILVGIVFARSRLILAGLGVLLSILLYGAIWFVMMFLVLFLVQGYSFDELSKNPTALIFLSIFSLFFGILSIRVLFKKK